MSAQEKHSIYTIGHSTHPLSAFIDMLKKYNIHTLVDIRRFPGSRKYPHFNKEFLAASLEKRGFEYIHLEALGGRRKNQHTIENSRWRNASFKAYAHYMESEAFEKGIEKLKEIAIEDTTAIMCSEAVWWRCHRSMVADYLKAKGWKVMHILGKNNVQEHPYTSPASVTNGNLSYTD